MSTEDVKDSLMQINLSQYANSFVENEINGAPLKNLVPGALELLGIRNEIHIARVMDVIDKLQCTKISTFVKLS